MQAGELRCLCDDFVQFVARVRRRLGLGRSYAAVETDRAPERVPGGIMRRAGHFGAAALFGGRSVRFLSASEQHDAEENDAAMLQTRRKAYVARLWADPKISWA